jgi:hypothetical protein
LDDAIAFTLGNKNLATSQQDVEAQQQGEKTAAAHAKDNCKN